MAAECTTISVAENPADPDGKQIDLHIARLQALSRDKKTDPVTLLAGGPGQSATQTYPTLATAFDKIRLSRDIYLLDQRGTGQSNPLSCPETEDVIDPFVFDADALARQTQQCLIALPGDPRFYTTSVAAADLEIVRKSLGIEQWNIYGISYGTRVALHYLKQHPSSVRSLIIDGVVPPDVSLAEGIALHAQRALDLMLQRCADSSACSERFPDLRSTTTSLLAELAAAPRDILFENFNTGKLEEMVFSYNHLALTLRMMSYSSQGVALLPLLINDAYKNNNYAPLARQSYLQASKITETLATGMHNAVICTEDQPFVMLDDNQRKELDIAYLGTTAVDALAATCRDWPAGVMDKNFRQAVVSDKPVLIFSGEADPVTPPAYGDTVAEHLTNSLHIINPGQGHMQANLGCTPTLMRNFIERGNVDDIDYGCLERQRPQAFFIDANGPKP